MENMKIMEIKYEKHCFDDMMTHMVEKITVANLITSTTPTKQTKDFLAFVGFRFHMLFFCS